VLPRRHPLCVELDRDASFRNLDGQLFASADEAGQFPLKVYQVVAP